MNAVVVGVEIEVIYNEPTQNADGSPIQDLDHTTIYADGGAGPNKMIDVPASSVNGGGLVVQRISSPVADGQEADVTVWATAFDGSGNESAQGTVVTIRIDKLAPAPPV
jgi:hypothetical protein